MTFRRGPEPQLSPYVLITLALCGGFAPFAIDAYLPGLPLIAREFGVSASTAQLTLTGFMVAQGLSQLVIGPLSDRLGRRLLLVGGTFGASAASLVCALAPNIQTLLAGRVLQGVLGAAGIVLSRAIATDLANRQGPGGRSVASVFSTLMAIQSVAPAVAPLVGGVIVPSWGWRGVFWFLAVLSLVLSAAVAMVVGESLDGSERRDAGVTSVVRDFGRLWRHRPYRTPTVMFWATFSAMFAYIAASSFVLQELAGFSEREFAVAFGINSLSLIAANITSGKVVARVGAIPLMTVGVTLTTLSVAWLIGWSLVGVHGLAICAGFFGLVASSGLLFPTVSATALQATSGMTGTGAALLGAGQALFAGAVAPLTGVLGASLVPMLVIMTVAVLVQGTCLVSIRRAAGRPVGGGRLAQLRHD